MKHGPSVGGQMRVADAIKRYRETGRLTGHASLHLDRLEAAFGNTRLGSLQTSDLAEWVDFLVHPKTGAAVAAWTKRHHFCTVKRFFEVCVHERWMDRNPMETLKPPHKDEDDIYVLPVKDAEKLFNAASKSIAVGRLALEAFAGLRYSSAARIAKADLDFKECGVTMQGKKHKSGRRHYAEGFPGNLWLWLEATPDQCWSLTERQYFEEKSRIFRAAGLKPEGKAKTEEEREQLARMRNVLRHSFASYHVALFGDAAKTAILLTHRNQAMLYQHYRGRATKRDAVAYFGIVPG
ncbi:MAG: hypothetical protein R3F07_03210 [Opitutaceae bacterium]